jgi:tetratricopeptide (TPR) repeat protein
MRLTAALIAALASLPLAAQTAPANAPRPASDLPRPAAQPTLPTPPSPPPAPRRPPPVATTGADSALYDAHCGKSAVLLAQPGVAITRVGFVTEPGRPARLILCVDSGKIGYPIPIQSVDMALVFMAYRPFAPFWPAAEARWGADMGLLREEVRKTPIFDAIAAYPYAKLMNPLSAYAMAASRTASGAADHAEARRLVEVELARLAERRARRPDRFDDDFDMSLMILRLGNLVAQREGASAGADHLKDLIARYPIDAQYRTNTDINLAAILAEAGRYDEALAIIEPLFAGFNPDPNDPDNYEIAGSVREFSWIMACALKGTQGAAAAGPFVTVVNSFRTEPVDQYLSATKTNAEIQLRMYKCLNDPEGFAATLRRNPPGFLAPIWIELQEHGRPIAGTRMLSAEVRRDLAKAFADKYRQLPERYIPALQAWAPLPAAAGE